MEQKVISYINENKGKFVDELKSWLRIPSVSADSKYKDDVIKAASFIEKDLSSMGLKTEIVQTAGNPIVYAEWLNAGKDKPTILIYGHYDVQPPDPLDKWLTPPFEPTERDGKIFARGATDDKGQCFTHVKACEAWLKQTGGLPVNVKFVIEGEEESGGDNLEIFIKNNPKKLSCDFVVVSDSSQFAPGIPAITYGLRGIALTEVQLNGPSQDLHSGTFGGAVANPANNLAAILADIHDKNAKVQIPGFYDDVISLEKWEKDQYIDLNFNEKEFCKTAGINETYGEKGFTTLERKWARPTCDINGLTSGYQGEGSKTIIPNQANAKVSFRMVPNQNPQKILDSFKTFVKERLWPGISVKFLSEHGAGAVLVPVKSKAVQSARLAIASAFGREPVFIREGGSIPIVASFKEHLGADTLLLGWGQNDDNLHSPNEKFSLEDFHKGIQASAKLLFESA